MKFENCDILARKVKFNLTERIRSWTGLRFAKKKSTLAAGSVEFWFENFEEENRVSKERSKGGNLFPFNLINLMSENKKRPGSSTGFTPENKRSKVTVVEDETEEATTAVRFLFDEETEVEIKGEPSFGEVEVEMEQNKEGIVELKVFCGRNIQTGLTREQWTQIWENIEELNEQRDDRGLATFKIFAKGHNKASGGYGFMKIRQEDEEELKKLVSKLKLDGKDLRAWSAGERPTSPTLVFRVVGAIAKRADEIIWQRIRRDNGFEGDGAILAVNMEALGKPKRFKVKPDQKLLEELKAKIANEDKKLWAGTLPTNFELYE